MRNRLAQHPTGWQAWYFVLALVAFLVGSQIMVVGQFVPALAPVIVPIQFVLTALLALLLVRLVSRRRITATDLGLKPGLRLWELGVIVAVFVLTHLVFRLLARLPGGQSDADRMFTDFGLHQGLGYALPIVVSTVILAPVCEELLFRGLLLRPVHDGLLPRFGRAGAAVVAVLVSSVAFAFPHLGDALLSPTGLAYLLTGVAFGFVYVVTGSLTGAMVSHALQSCYAFAQILYFGHGEHTVSPVLWVLVVACPVLVFLVARALYAILPKESAAR